MNIYMYLFIYMYIYTYNYIYIHIYIHIHMYTKVAWNTQVVHILASAAQNGSTIIWDLRQKKAWCELRDPAGGCVRYIYEFIYVYIYVYIYMYV
jgi:WD40 repeat protein